jgi:hypothetical protein
MASFSHELLNSSQDPVRKTERDRGLNPLESGCSHERPDNDIRGGGRRPTPLVQNISRLYPPL